MQLTIIMICSNIKGAIEKTCESIVNQTFQDFEWIVIDGGSTDGTLDVLEKYKSRINIFVSEKDNGIYSAMNKGVLRSKGKYLNFMNGGDCFYSNDALEKSVKYFQSDADVYYADVKIVKLDGNQYIQRQPHNLVDEFFLQTCLPHQSSFIKQELFNRFGLYDESYKIVSDYEKWIIYFKNSCNFEFINEIIAVQYHDGISAIEDKLHGIERKIVANKYLYSKTQKLMRIFIRRRIKNNRMQYMLFNLIPLISYHYCYNGRKAMSKVDVSLTDNDVYSAISQAICNINELNKKEIAEDKYYKQFERISNIFVRDIISELINEHQLSLFLYDAITCYKQLILAHKYVSEDEKMNIERFFVKQLKKQTDVEKLAMKLLNNKIKRKVYLFSFLPISI